MTFQVCLRPLSNPKAEAVYDFRCTNERYLRGWLRKKYPNYKVVFVKAVQTKQKTTYQQLPLFPTA